MQVPSRAWRARAFAGAEPRGAEINAPKRKEAPYFVRHALAEFAAGRKTTEHQVQGTQDFQSRASFQRKKALDRFSGSKRAHRD